MSDVLSNDKEPVAKIGLSRSVFRRRAVRVLRWLACVSLVVLAIPPVQVLYVKWADPSTTGPIILRAIASKGFGLHSAPAEMVWRNIDSVPPYFLKCVWCMEDWRYFSHHGFDWVEIARARRIAEKTGKPVRGASTITQQCARSLFLYQQRSWLRKGLETYYTIWMELLLSKRRILELYVNVIELGDGIYGIEAASQYYCVEPASKLSKRECALLACVLPKPLSWNPVHPSTDVLNRRAEVMKRADTVKLPSELHLLKN